MPSQLSGNEKSSITDFTLCEYSMKCIACNFGNFSLFFSVSMSLFFNFFLRKRNTRNPDRFRDNFPFVKINRASLFKFETRFQNGGEKVRNDRFEKRERRTGIGRRFEPIVEWNLSGSLMNEIVHRSRSLPLRLLFIFSHFFSRFSLHRSILLLSTLAIAFPAWATGRFKRPLDFPQILSIISIWIYVRFGKMQNSYQIGQFFDRTFESKVKFSSPNSIIFIV